VEDRREDGEEAGHQDLGQQLVVRPQQCDWPQLGCKDASHLWQEVDDSLAHGGRKEAFRQHIIKGLQQRRAHQRKRSFVKLIGEAVQPQGLVDLAPSTAASSAWSMRCCSRLDLWSGSMEGRASRKFGYRDSSGWKVAPESTWWPLTEAKWRP